MKNKIVLLLPVLIFTFSFTALGEEKTEDSTTALTTEELQETISGAVSWFKAAQERNGHFRYEYTPFLNRYVDDDNMVRQTGVLYALGELIVRDKEHKYDLKETMERAIEYFEKNSYTGKMNGYEFRCVLKNDYRCAMGATGLALVGTIDLVRAHPELETKYKDLIEDYLNYILAMRNKGEGFRVYYYTDGRSQSKSELAFANGEAFLALAKYYEYKPSDELKSEIQDVFNYFKKKHTLTPDKDFYLWGMAAVKVLYWAMPEDRYDYYLFVKDFTDWRMAPYIEKRNSTLNRCAYIEGVISAYSVLGPNVTNDEYYLEEIDFWLGRSKMLQIKAGDVLKTALNDRKANKLRLGNPKKAVGGFLSALQEPVQRIDNTQHCMNSYVQKLVDIDGEEL